MGFKGTPGDKRGHIEDDGDRMGLGPPTSGLMVPGVMPQCLGSCSRPCSSSTGTMAA